MYSLLKPIFFSRDPEEVHEHVLRRLERSSASRWQLALLRAFAGACPSQPVSALGRTFPHPLGLAAGFDKDARAIPALCALNFAFVEIGTVTPLPQPGNEKPRIWRFPEANALVNALGFPGEGMHAVRQRLTMLRERHAPTRPVGINLGKNAVTPLERAGDDYQAVLRELLELGDYFVVNVSSPNTPGLRTLQEPDSLRKLLGPLQSITARKRPLLLKVAPDLADEDLNVAARVVNELGLAGIVSANTSVRRALVPAAASLQRGGLSGAPIYPRMLECLRLLKSELNSTRIVIAAGGIDSAARARETLAAGAALLQVYTAFIYHGPRVVSNLIR
ncbi:MAG: quinone-dependent dihydroorotate dehydrogenase [bacterium]|nr:quinone-dependent dihydroorotate dehydrogenase [bacterium]